MNYAKAKYFKEYKDFIFDLINFPSNEVVEYNVNAIINLCKLLNIDIINKLYFSSQFSFNSKSNQLLIDLTKAVNCDTYMAGGGSSGYQDIAMFEKQKINFIYQNFKHPVYKQVNISQFLEGLSIIDFIFNQGIKGVKNGYFEEN